jgi:biopolymer transport protein ExbD
MNPLIDVALVLLVFFILTTTYETIRKVIDAPGLTPEQKNAPLPKLTSEQIARLVKVKAYKQNGKTVIEVEGQPVEEQNLERVLKRFYSEQRDEVLIDAKDVDWGTLVFIQDAAKGAGFRKGHFPRPPKTPPA